MAGGDGAPELGEHQVGTVDTRDVLVASSREPDQGHAVGCHHPGGIEDAAQLVRALALHHAVHGTDAHVSAIAGADEPIDLIERPVHVDQAHADAEHVDSLRPAHEGTAAGARTSR